MAKNESNSRKRGCFEIAAFLILMAVLTLLAGKPILSAVSDPVAFREKIQAYGWAGRLIFLLMMFVQTVIAFIPGEPLEIAAGYAFGAWEGTLLSVTGQAAGSVCVFLFVRKFGVKLVEVFVSREKINSLRFLKNEKKLETLVFFVFLMPGTPKDALCYFAGLTPMRLSVWLLISSVARLPSVITSTIGGNALGFGRMGLAAIVFACTMAVSAAGYFVYGRVMAARARRQEEGRKSFLTEKREKLQARRRRKRERRIGRTRYRRKEKSA